MIDTERVTHFDLKLTFGVPLALAALVVTRPADSASSTPSIETARSSCTQYADYLRPFVGNIRLAPDRGQYGPRHALPALAQYVRNPDGELAAGILGTLRHYGMWVDREITAKGGVQSMEGMTLLAIYRREFLRTGVLDQEDQRWFRTTMLKLRRYSYGLKPGDGPWRGTQHRGMVSGTNDLLAAALFPDDTQSAEWRETGEKVWNDWWTYRDIGINDIAYFYDSLSIMLRAADVLGRNEVFTDAAAKSILWDRLLYETSPDGALIPYGSHAGWNGLAGVRIYALELAAAKAGDGRYRFVSNRLFDYARSHGGFSPGQEHWAALSLESLALASIACDDRVMPVAPDSGSRRLDRPEIVRLTPEQARNRDPAGGIFDASMDMSPRLLPSKLILRSGWDPGDMFMLVEAFARHDPLNPTAILGFERFGSSFAEMISEKEIARENAVAIEDLSGTAQSVGGSQGRGRRQLPAGYAAMATAVEAFADDPLTTLARLRVDNYGGLRASQTREMLFIKNRFVLVRDETRFADSFRARVGPVWNTQKIAALRGENWVDTAFAGHWYNAQLKLYGNPDAGMLLWYVPRAQTTLSVLPARIPPVADGVQQAALRHIIETRYAWQGEVAPGDRKQFTAVLLPHRAAEKPVILARGIMTLRDEPGLAAIAVAAADRWELAVLNNGGGVIDLPGPQGTVTTDAQSLYLSLRPDGAVSYSARGATVIRLNGRELFLSNTRADRHQR